MSWIFFALLAPAIYASVTFIDKYIISKKVKDYQCMTVYATIAAVIGGGLIWAITGFPILSLFDTVLVLFVGMLTMASFVVYYKALALDDASNINILFQMFPVFVLLFSALFLHETITLTQLLGFIMVSTAVIGASLQSTNNKIHLSRAFFLILLYDLFLSSSAILMKFAINANSFSQILSYQSFGIGIGGAVIYALSPSIRKSFRKSLKTIGKFTISIMFFNEGLFILGRSLTYYAFSVGTIALVSVLEGTQVFYGLLIGWGFTIILPSIIKENLSKQVIIRKFLLCLLLIMGIWLVY